MIVAAAVVVEYCSSRLLLRVVVDLYCDFVVVEFDGCAAVELELVRLRLPPPLDWHPVVLAQRRQHDVVGQQRLRQPLHGILVSSAPSSIFLGLVFDELGGLDAVLCTVQSRE